MKAVNVNDVLKILNEYGEFVFVTDSEKYSEMVRKIANLPEFKKEAEPCENAVLDKIKAEIENHCGLIKENPCKCYYCYYCHCVIGVREVLEIINKYKKERTDEQH